jgi:hypothetical protein
MKKLTKPVISKPAKQNPRDKQRGIATVGLLVAASTLNAAVVVAALIATKRPPLAGD